MLACGFHPHESRKAWNNMRCFPLFLACIVILGCGGGSGPSIPSIPIDELRAAPEQVEIGGTEYHIYFPLSELTRDFFPGANPPDGGPLRAWVFIVDDAGHQMQPRYVYVINGTEVWQSELDSEGRSTSDGPKWETGILVDMVVMVCHDNEYYLIKATDVVIARLD